jgi:hypothetical protein
LTAHEKAIVIRISRVEERLCIIFAVTILVTGGTAVKKDVGFAASIYLLLKVIFKIFTINLPNIFHIFKRRIILAVTYIITGQAAFLKYSSIRYTFILIFSIDAPAGSAKTTNINHETILVVTEAFRKTG